ncbi:hypothetical protein F5144DRAFT_634895 [Chaetomium tenue]|uniref:Uncharacterized protein n=1 Tax=Chaetomium tenue TaxID=1854479 RepID=A0ACB7PQT2_9PEZI|nr:hypothetical protein F5144DRAFT_634895 [Chaetomium globosum]
MTTIFDAPGTNSPNPFSPLIQQAFHAGTPEAATFDELAAQIVKQVTASPDPANAFWSLWDAFFVAITTSPPLPPTAQGEPFASPLSLLDALRAHPPTTPPNVAAGSDAELKLRTTYLDKTSNTIPWSNLPGFAAQWRDMHDILEAWRDWDGIRRGSGNATDTATRTEVSHERYDPAQCFLRFISFSVALLQQEHEQHRRRDGGGGAPLFSIWVFFSCKNVLERADSAAPPQPPERKGHCLSPEQVWALDVRVMATWVRGGAGVLWEADWEGELRRVYAAALDEKTERWSRGGGLTRERGGCTTPCW